MHGGGLKNNDSEYNKELIKRNEITADEMYIDYVVSKNYSPQSCNKVRIFLNIFNY